MDGHVNVPLLDLVAQYRTIQGEVLPAYMWDKRLSCRTPMPGVYLCGAATHPGGSVIAINGRNAAMEILGERVEHK